MTLTDLIRKANEMARQLSSGDVPLYDYEYDIPIKNIDLELLEDEEGPFVQMNIELNWNDTN